MAADDVRSVEDVMTGFAVTAEPHDTMAQVRQVMHQNGVHCVPIVDDELHPLGIISSYDLVVDRPADATASSVMTKDVITVTAHTLTSRAAAEMVVNFVHHLLVVNDAGQVIGVLSALDLLGELASRWDVP